MTASETRAADEDLDEPRFEYNQGTFAAEARRQRISRNIRKVGAYTTLSVFVVIAVGPAVYLISPAFRDSVSLFSYPPEWLPSEPTIENYRFLFRHTEYLRWAVNTLIYATGVTLIALVTNTLAAYAFATMKFPGHRTLFFLVLATMMIPVAAVLAPTYLTVRMIGGWPIIGNFIDLDTYGGLILPSAVSPLGVFMMRQFIETLPSGLYEAARLDGASEWRILRKIVLPLLKPALVVLGIFVFMLTWASYLWPLVAATNNDHRVLTVGIQSLNGQFVTNWGVMAAAALLTIIPVTIVFLFFQKWFVQASMAGALKQ
ncbi:MAG: carbohydrate ABC transporter permease [Acidimicrobiaceae bacterium]|jgi:ABC-type glycerol-3-phosphate transport system permease component|nr:carbohydrate ABC transporter permease [Acidimicrobiaceae bacterium]